MASSLVSPITSKILSSAAVGAIIPISGEGILSVSTDASYPGATMTFNVAIDPNATGLQQMRKGDGSGAYSLAISANQTLPVPAEDFAGYSQLQPVAASDAGADSIVTFGVRPV